MPWQTIALAVVLAGLRRAVAASQDAAAWSISARILTLYSAGHDRRSLGGTLLTRRERSLR